MFPSIAADPATTFSTSDEIFLIVSLLLTLGVYLLPTIVAAARRLPSTGQVAVINVLLGWTFVGWVIALAMASKPAPPPPGYWPPPGNWPPPGYQPQPPPYNWPQPPPTNQPQPPPG